MEQVKSSAWYNGDTLDRDSVIAEFQERKKLVDAKVKEDKSDEKE